MVKGEGVDGSRCGKIWNSGSHRNGYGNIRQLVDATPFRGQTLELKVMMRGEKLDTDKWAGFYIIMGEKTVAAKVNPSHTGWKEYSLSIVVAKDAQSLFLVGQLAGRGTLWVDEVKITSPPTVPQVENGDFEK
jgi:hypothetical protein